MYPIVPATRRWRTECGRAAVGGLTALETQALRLLIRQKLADGRLPRNGVPRVGGSHSDGQQCCACEALVAKSEFVMEALLLGNGRIRAAVSFHVHCFHIWDDERRRLRRSAATGTDRESGVETYKEHTIVTAATEERAAAGACWSPSSIPRT